MPIESIVTRTSSRWVRIPQGGSEARTAVTTQIGSENPKVRQASRQPSEMSAVGGHTMQADDRRRFDVAPLFDVEYHGRNSARS